MKKTLAALPTLGTLFIADAALACPPSETDLVVAGGILLTTAVVALGAVTAVAVGVTRFVRRRIAKNATIV